MNTDELDIRLLEELPGLRALARTLAKRREDAEDLLQDSVERALRYLRSYDPAKPLGHWLRGIVYRAWIDQRERMRREPAPRDVEVVHRGRGCAAAEAREELEYLLAGLSPGEREALLRFHRDGESIEEIAGALRAPAGTIKSILHRARRKLARRRRAEQ